MIFSSELEVGKKKLPKILLVFQFDFEIITSKPYIRLANLKIV